VTGLILDTNAYAGFLRGDHRAASALKEAPEIHLPLIVLGELLAGFRHGSRQRDNRDELARFMASPRVQLMRPDEKTAHQYAEVYHALRVQGTPIPTNDLWIASLARQHRIPLLTFDAHFRAVPDITLI
jgi:predicted nucleic acid-binding protein